MANTGPWVDVKKTARIVLADGTIIEAIGCGAEGVAVAEICFNTAITGYQEILTDPSYAGQIVTFTFPHIGNVGANAEDVETLDMSRRKDCGAVGAVFKAPISQPSNYRANGHFDDWLKSQNIIGAHSVDTRALTAMIREKGLANAVIAHNENGVFDHQALRSMAANWAGLEHADLAKDVTSKTENEWDQSAWQWGQGYGSRSHQQLHVVAMDFGIKRNILRLFAQLNCRLTVVPADSSAESILALKPDGVFLSNGPGDPAATGEYAVPTVKALISHGLPIFGICLGHQILALALGAKTKKMHQGHHGANHPVKDHTTGKVEIVSMNHGFCVDGDSLPEDVNETHVSLFDRSNCGLALQDKPVFSVQHHPEASPGPQDSHYLFVRFVNLMRQARGESELSEAQSVVGANPAG